MNSGPKQFKSQIKHPEETDFYAGLEPDAAPAIDEPVTKKDEKSYPRQRVIAVDVDDTLVINGKVNKQLADWCKVQRAKGFYMILWSAAGEHHARMAARKAGVVFDCIISKPGHIVDDMGWGWIGYTQEIKF